MSSCGDLVKSISSGVVRLESDNIIIRQVSDALSAKEMFDFLENSGVYESMSNLAKKSHVPDSPSYRLAKQCFAQKFGLNMSADSVQNLFMFLNRHSDVIRGAMSRTAEESNFDKSIDTGLLVAYEDILSEYSELSAKVHAMPITDPERVSFTKELRSLRREMREFKELVAPAVQKMDVKSEVNDMTKATNNALTNAVARLGIK